LNLRPLRPERSAQRRRTSVVFYTQPPFAANVVYCRCGKKQPLPIRICLHLHPQAQTL